MPVIPPRLPGLAGVQDTFNRFDLKLKATLVEGRSESEFTPVMSAGILDELGFMTIDVDRRIFVAGVAEKEKQTFFVVRSPGDAWFKGDTSRGNGDICGFKSSCDQTAAHWVGKCQAIFLPKGAMEQHLDSIGAQPAIERMRKVNTLRVSPALFDDFCRLQTMGCNGVLREKAQIYSQLSVALMCGTDNPDTVVTKNWDRAFAAFNMAHSVAMGEPISVKELADALFCSESCINKASKECFGCTIGRLMECARIAQAHIALATTTATVKQAMSTYGFTNAGRFAKKHKELFGTLPTQQLPLLKYSEGKYVARRIKVELKPYRFRQDLD